MPLNTAPIFPPALNTSNGVSNGWVIEDNDRSAGLPVFFSLKARAQTAAAQGWTEVIADALQFARHQDAEAFLARYLPNQTLSVKRYAK